MKTVLFASLFAAAFALASCAHNAESSSSSTGTQESAEESGPVVGPPQVAWKDMTKKQRGRYMKEVVMPKMQPLFAEFDPKHFEKITCKTCHGNGVADHSFKMPNPDLPALPDSEEVFKATVMVKKPEMVKFMAGKVTPTMAELLGIPAFNPAQPDPNAFSCHGCHTLKHEAMPESSSNGEQKKGGVAF